MKKYLFQAICFLLLCNVVRVYGADEKTPINLSIYPPIAIFEEAKVYGIDLGLLGTQSEIVYGYQYSLFHSRVNKCYGIQESWIYASADNAYGIQSALVSKNKTCYGLQGGFVCISETVFGMQGNIGLFGKTNYLKGVQINVLNICKEEIHGVQIGVLNIAGRLKGVQIGALNIIIDSKIIPAMIGLNISW